MPGGTAGRARAVGTDSGSDGLAVGKKSDQYPDAGDRVSGSGISSGLESVGEERKLKYKGTPGVDAAISENIS